MKAVFDKWGGLIPAIIQDSKSHQVLMLGFMNEEALKRTQSEGKVTFFSRSKNRLWTKGETSGHYLTVVEIHIDCDQDTLLIFVTPNGPVCHTGTVSCFHTTSRRGYLYQLEQTIAARIADNDVQSYTARLFHKGVGAVAQKVGEEAVEVVIEAVKNDGERLKSEAADLLFHLLVLLKMQGYTLEDIEEELASRAR